MTKVILMPNPKQQSIKEMVKKPFAKKELAFKVEQELKERETRPEQGIETGAETKAETMVQASQVKKIKPIPKAITAASMMSEEEKKRQKQIESILAADLEKIYLNLSPAKQKEFKLKGEQTATEINKLMSKIKVKVKEIVNLIIRWLKIIPGVNEFFLEQEAKIKADEIMKIKNNTKY